MMVYMHSTHTPSPYSNQARRSAPCDCSSRKKRIGACPHEGHTPEPETTCGHCGIAYDPETEGWNGYCSSRCNRNDSY